MRSKGLTTVMALSGFRRGGINGLASAFRWLSDGFRVAFQMMEGQKWG